MEKKSCEVCDKPLLPRNKTGLCQEHYVRGVSPRRDIYRRYWQKRVDLINEIKVAQGCADCGYNTHPEALDFDHLPGTEKLFNVSQAKMKPLELLLAEIEKCEVVCCNCHRVRTAHRRDVRNDPE